MKGHSNDWCAWRVDEDEVRVQIHRPDLAKAFGKEKAARLVGYSVTGHYAKLFHVKKSVDWVDTWMKKFLREAKAELN
jgi:hypothetical protein